jgi:type IV fimbrial biogenesis protein FimT
VELLVVVVIITVFATLAWPQVSERMRDQRTRAAALKVTEFYQVARMRAMGRGTAVLVRFAPGAGRGRLEMHEAQTGAVGCAAMPVPSCSFAQWDDPASLTHRAVTEFDINIRSEFENVEMIMDGTGTLDVCFTPMGRTFARDNVAANLGALNDVHTATVRRNVGGDVIGLSRTVVILPNGIARFQ